jgi:hypothetical protein
MHLLAGATNFYCIQFLPRLKGKKNCYFLIKYTLLVHGKIVTSENPEFQVTMWRASRHTQLYLHISNPKANYNTQSCGGSK